MAAVVELDKRLARQAAASDHALAHWLRCIAHDFLIDVEELNESESSSLRIDLSSLHGHWSYEDLPACNNTKKMSACYQLGAAWRKLFRVVRQFLVQRGRGGRVMRVSGQTFFWCMGQGWEGDEGGGGCNLTL